MLVTLVVYSGLVDPYWQYDLSSSDYLSIQAVGYSPDCIPSRLYYKGFLVVDAGGVERLIVGVDVESVRLQNLLFQTMPSNTIPSRLQRRVSNEIGSVYADCPGGLAGKRKRRGAPLYKPALWNNNAFTRRNNNCYNYGNDKITNTFAQPGRGGPGGLIFNQLAGAAVRNAAVRDGLVVLNPHPGVGDPVPGAPVGLEHLVALFVDPGQ